MKNFIDHGKILASESFPSQVRNSGANQGLS